VNGALIFLVSSCVGVGSCLGGISNIVQAFERESALSNPAILYLVDESGNPVSKVGEKQFR